MPFLRGAIPTPRHKLLAARPHIAGPAPSQFAALPKMLSMWGNSKHGDCVSAEEAFAIAAYSVMCGQPERFVSEQTVIDWASQRGFLEGANLTPVMDAMSSDGMSDGTNLDKDGGHTGVNYADEATLQSAISQGPVKLGMDANALPHDAGNKQGWFAFGGSPGQFSTEDHCTSLCGYGPTAWLAQELERVYGVTVTLPANAPANGYLHFTWSTIGIVDHAWIMSTVGEAWLRNPTTVGELPGPGPNPDPNPDPPKPSAKVKFTGTMSSVGLSIDGIFPGHSHHGKTDPNAPVTFEGTITEEG